MESTLLVEIERHFHILEDGRVILKVGPDPDGSDIVEIEDLNSVSMTYLTKEAARALAKVLQELTAE